MKCPRCQHENEAAAKFCEQCRIRRCLQEVLVALPAILATAHAPA